MANNPTISPICFPRIFPFTMQQMLQSRDFNVMAAEIGVDQSGHGFLGLELKDETAEFRAVYARNRPARRILRLD